MSPRLPERRRGKHEDLTPIPRDDRPGRADTMAERSTLRGSRLGATSYEDERGVEFADRQAVVYDCAHGHRFEMTFSVEAEGPDEKPIKPPRTHWDMLLERRSVEDLEILLDERLELLRAGLLPGGA